MTKTRLSLLALLLSSAGCLAPAGPDTGDFEHVGGSLDGFHFLRPIDVTTAVEPGDQELEGHFTPDRYAAYRFRGEQGKVYDVVTWQDFNFSDWWDDVYLTQLVFMWSPQPGSSNVNDPNNWSLLRYDTGFKDVDGSCWCVGADQRTIFTAPASTDYLVVFLTTEANYTSGRAHHSIIKHSGDEEGRPGSISIELKYSNGAPVPGVRVAVGATAMTTDARGRVKFENLVPNLYTVKMGPNGWEKQIDVHVLAGRAETRRITLDTPL